VRDRSGAPRSARSRSWLPTVAVTLGWRATFVAAIGLAALVLVALPSRAVALARLSDHLRGTIPIVLDAIERRHEGVVLDAALAEPVVTTVRRPMTRRMYIITAPWPSLGVAIAHPTHRRLRPRRIAGSFLVVLVEVLPVIRVGFRVPQHHVTRPRLRLHPRPSL
jgi:hypothetical protein